MLLAISVDEAVSEASPVSGTAVMVPTAAAFTPTRVTVNTSWPCSLVRPFLTELPPSNRAEPVAVARTS
ncbi:unannotated protein [freshwater metagenome]|uniref:Unannotated protein n=1 Tax=freshwater metagenome TaxID=449393 RepID=A0A6J7HE66_9ZZZZ